MGFYEPLYKCAQKFTLFFTLFPLFTASDFIFKIQDSNSLLKYITFWCSLKHEKKKFNRFLRTGEPGCSCPKKNIAIQKYICITKKTRGKMGDLLR